MKSCEFQLNKKNEDDTASMARTTAVGQQYFYTVYPVESSRQRLVRLGRPHS